MAYPDDRYWVGGAGAWDASSTAHWSLTSGGSSGASVPTSANSVFFDQAGTYTVTISATVNCLDLTISAGTVSFISPAQTINIYGSFSSIAGTSWDTSTKLSFKSTTTGKTISCLSDVAAGVEFNGVGGGWTLTNNFNNTSIAGTSLINGALSLGSYTFKCLVFNSSNSNTRTLAFGTGKIYIYASFSLFSITNLTITGTPVIEIDSSTSTVGITLANIPEATAISLKHVTGTNQISLIGVIASGIYTLSVKNFDFTGFAGTLNLNSANNINVYGNFTFGATTVVSASNKPTLIFAATSGTKTITSNGNALACNFTFSGVGGTWQLQDNLAPTSTIISITGGTLDLNGKTFTATTNAFSNTGANARNITFNGGTLVCTENYLATGSNFTTTAGTGVGKISMTSAATKAFYGGGFTYNCTLSNDSASTLNIINNNTFTTLTNTVSPTTFTFGPGDTQTITNFSIAGTAGNLVTIQSGLNTIKANLSSSTQYLQASYTSIKTINATGGAAWYADTTCVDAGNNTGWIFSKPEKFFLLFVDIP